MHATIRINEGCNLACKYCSDRNHSVNSCEMSMQTADAVLDYCKANNISKVDIPQQEPLRSFPILKYIIERFSENENNVRVGGITTNLYNLPREALHLFKKHNIFVLASFDGLWHDQFRLLPDGSPTSELIEKNLLALKGAGIRFNIACCIVHDVVDRIYNNYKYLSGITSGIAFNFDTTSPFAIQDADVPIIKSEFTKIASETLSIFPLNKIKQRVSSNARYSNFMCGAGRGSYTIDYDGTIYPCYHCSAWRTMGFSLGDIYKGVDEQRQKKFHHYDSATREKCGRCSSALCGICYVNSYNVMGDMLAPIPINCKIFQALTDVVKEVMVK